MYGTKSRETVGDIGEQEHFEFATYAKKGYHFSNSSPFCLDLFWHLACPLLVSQTLFSPQVSGWDTMASK